MPSSQPLDQVVGREIDDLDVVGPVDDGVWNRLAHPDARDLRHDVVQAFDMLDVERRIDVDAVRQDFLNVEIALGMAAARRVGVGKFVDEDQRRTPGKDGVEVHFLEDAALVVDPRAGNDLEAVDQRLGFLAAVRLDDADHHVHAVGQSCTARHQHFIGLADAGGGAEKDLQTAARLPLRMVKQRVG